MTEPIYEFSPTVIGVDVTLILLLLVTVVSLIAATVLYRKYTSKYKQLGFMLAGFIALIAGSTAWFYWLSSSRKIPIQLFESQLTTGFGTVAYKDLKGVYIHPLIEKSSLNPSVAIDTTYIMVIQQKNGQSYSFSEEDYPVFKIVELLGEQVDKNK